MVEFKVKFEETDFGFDTEFSSENDVFNVGFDNMSVVTASDHNVLVNRDMPNQHPISAIVGLESELSGKLEAIPAMTNMEIENILKGFV